jgi:glycosyltransferase involved in cell wall biosynthesis
VTRSRHSGLPEAIALVQDALPCLGGAERVLETVAELFPAASVYTLVYEPRAFVGTGLGERRIHTSFIDRLPGAHRNHRAFLPLFPLAIERFDLTAYDIILSSHYAVAHGVLARPDQLHISYTYTPLRHAWHYHHEYLRTLSAPARWVAGPILHYLRMWDRAAADRVDRFLAISDWVAACIWRAYRRKATVVYPPVDIEAFQPKPGQGDHYIAVARLEPHKRIDLIVDAFARLGRPLFVVGDGSERGRLMDRAPSNVEFLGRVTDAELADLLARARGLVHAAEEDFGIALVEAQAAGCPVVAYAGGAAGEIVQDGRTGILFQRQTGEALEEAVRTLERTPRFRTQDLVRNAERFSKARFERELERVVTREWQAFGERRTGRGGDRSGRGLDLAREANGRHPA